VWLDGTQADVSARAVGVAGLAVAVGARGSRGNFVTHVVGDGLRWRRCGEIGVDVDRQPAAQAEHGACGKLYMPRQRLLDGSDGLVHLGIAEARREADYSRLNHARGLACKHVGNGGAPPAQYWQSSWGRMKKLKSPWSEPVCVSAVSMVAFSVRP